MEDDIEKVLSDETLTGLPQKVKLGLLFSVYGALLNENRARVMELWLDDDLSLSEIAEQAGITRQGVHDSIKKSEKRLLDYEDKLKVARKMLQTERYIKLAEAQIDASGKDPSADVAKDAFRAIMGLWEDDIWRSKG